MNSDRELDITILEDLQHLSELWDQSDITNSQIRNSVHILRRLLIYGDLQKSANLRKHRLMISAPDVKLFATATRNNLLEFFQCGGTNVLGVYVANLTVAKGNANRINRLLDGHNPDARVSLSITSFLRQTVFSFKGAYISREDVIKYVANKAGNAHFDRKGRDLSVDRIRAAVTISKTEEGHPSIGFNFDALISQDFQFTPDPKNIDPVFIEVAATARFLVESESVKELSEMIKSEHAL